MTHQEAEGLEEQRCAAMLQADCTALDRLLSDDLRWAHASGKVDTKAQMLAQFGEGSMRVHSLDRSQTETRIFGTAAVVMGIVVMDATVGGVRKDVRSRYCGVWSSHAGAPQLVTWQSARIG